jgi:transcriptional regulator with XRE-family HTH domain
MNEIGKKIKRIRLKRGFSQEELAETAKLNLRTIQRIENNETVPRGKTLKLIFEALDIEIIEIEKEKTKFDKQLIWSSFLTILIITCSFFGWFQYEVPVKIGGQRMYSIVTSTGWNGNINLNDFDFQNWFLSISSISIGLIVISYSLGFIENKIRYIILQLLCVSSFLIAINILENGEIRPSLFIVLVATILLIITYLKNKKTGANKELS